MTFCLQRAFEPYLYEIDVLVWIVMHLRQSKTFLNVMIKAGQSQLTVQIECYVKSYGKTTSSSFARPFLVKVQEKQQFRTLCCIKLNKIVLKPHFHRDLRRNHQKNFRVNISPKKLGKVGLWSFQFQVKLNNEPGNCIYT